MHGLHVSASIFVHSASVMVLGLHEEVRISTKCVFAVFRLAT